MAAAGGKIEPDFATTRNVNRLAVASRGSRPAGNRRGSRGPARESRDRSQARKPALPADLHDPFAPLEIMMRNPGISSRRARTSCSVLALATVLVIGATPVSAQSFLGTGTYTTNPNATGITTTPTTTTINGMPDKT